jgi:hypothetical protein
LGATNKFKALKILSGEHQFIKEKVVGRDFIN